MRIAEALDIVIFDDAEALDGVIFDDDKAGRRVVRVAADFEPAKSSWCNVVRSMAIWRP